MLAARTNALVIRTPEGIEFSMQLAGPLSRFLAWLIDAACISAVMTVVGAVLQIVIAVHRQFGLALHILAAFAVAIGYAMALEWLWRGQTLGKRLLRLRVVDEQGLRLKFSQIAVRNLLRAVDSLPLFYLVGGLACLFSPRAQGPSAVAAAIEAAGDPGRYGLVALWNAWMAMRYRSAMPAATFELLVRPWVTVVGRLPD